MKKRERERERKRERERGRKRERERERMKESKSSNAAFPIKCFSCPCFNIFGRLPPLKLICLSTQGPWLDVLDS